MRSFPVVCNVDGKYGKVTTVQKLECWQGLRIVAVGGRSLQTVNAGVPSQDNLDWANVPEEWKNNQRG